MDLFATDIRQAGPDVLVIAWNDGTESSFRVFDLRAACPCAHCVDELTGERLLDPKVLDPEVKPRTIDSVGNYAIKISWSDGHDTGIYSWDRLRALADAAAS
jgi:ATP-binding protein involved in chromosome partitioning